MIRELRPGDPDEPEVVDLIARRMRATLAEVLSAERADEMYDHEALVARVRWHLDRVDDAAAVFVAERDDGSDDLSLEHRIVGHTIVRLDDDHAGRPVGLFSTTYVDPTRRRSGVADRLLDAGERWLVDHGARRAATYTDAANRPLQELYRRRGYTIERVDDEWTTAWRSLDRRS